MLKALIAGRRPRCEPTGATSYGRTVAVCYVGDLDLGAALVLMGWAFVNRDWSYTTRYLPLQKHAQAMRDGAWAGEPIMPWVWRQARH